MKEFVVVKLRSGALIKVHYTQLHKNISNGLWFWQGELVELPPKLNEILEDKYEVQPSSKDITDEYIKKHK